MRSIKATSYIDSMVTVRDTVSALPTATFHRLRLCKFPAHWSHIPADETLVRAWEAATATRTPACASPFSWSRTTDRCLVPCFTQVTTKFRPEICAALGLCGACLTFPTEELYNYNCLLHIRLVYLGRSRHLGTTFSAHVDARRREQLMPSLGYFFIMLAGSAIACVSGPRISVTSAALHHDVVVRVGTGCAR